MKTKDQSLDTFENINTPQKITLFVVSVITIVHWQRTRSSGLSVIDWNPVHTLMKQMKRTSHASHDENNFYQENYA